METLENNRITQKHVKIVKKGINNTRLRPLSLEGQNDHGLKVKIIARMQELITKLLAIIKGCMPMQELINKVVIVFDHRIDHKKIVLFLI